MAQGVLDTGYTAVLCHFDGTDGQTTTTDESGKTVTRGGDAQLRTDYKKFGTASTYLDGTGDFWYWSDHADFYLSGDFTIDFWARFADFPSAGSYYQIWEQYQDSTNFQTVTMHNIGGAHYLQFYCRDTGGVLINCDREYSGNFLANTWYHVKITRSGNDYRIFVDGVQLGSTETDASTIPNYTGTVYVGCHSGTTSFFCGWLDEFRILNGLCTNTGNFTPPTTEYVPNGDDIYTKLLCHYNGPDTRALIQDEMATSSQKRVWTFAGNAQVDIAQYKFGSSSLLLDGTGDCVYTDDTSDLYINQQDFTLEMWVRFNSLPSAGNWQCMFSHPTSTSTRMIFLVFNNSGTYCLRGEVWNSSANLIYLTRDLAGFTTGTWYHLAWTRSSGYHRLFLDGTMLGAAEYDGSAIPDFAGAIIIGSSDASNNFINGWIDELRYSIGIARYTSNFSVETSPWGPSVTHEESITAVDTHMLMDNEIDITLPTSVVDFAGTLEWRLLEITLPLDSIYMSGIVGEIGSISIPLPIISPSISLPTGELASIDIDLLAPTASLNAAGKMALDMPLLVNSVDMLTGTVAQLNTILPSIASSLVGHMNGIGTMSITLPRDIMVSTGRLHGVGSIAMTMPLYKVLATGLTGQVGSLGIDLPDITITVRSSSMGNMVLDITMPILLLDNYGVYQPVSVSYKGVVINTMNMSVTEYEGFQFNSMGSLLGHDIGVNENGIYIVRGNNNLSESSILSGNYDMGGANLNYPRNAWLTMRSDGRLTMTVVMDEGDKYEYDVTGLSDAIHEERVKFGKGLKGRVISIGLKNSEGADFDISKLAIFGESIQSKKR